MKTYENIEAWIRECFGILSQDVRTVLKNRFPAIATEGALAQHIPIDSLYAYLVDNATYEQLRRGLTNIAAYTVGLGYETRIRSFLDELTNQRYRLLIFPQEGFLLGSPETSNVELLGVLGEKGYLGNYNGLILTLFDAVHHKTVQEYLDIVLPPYIAYTIKIEEKEL